MTFRTVGRFAALALGFGINTCATVIGKPRDTPSYLIPYYLRDTRLRFNYFASISDCNERYMSTSDFFRSILVCKRDEEVNEDMLSDLQNLFQTLDMNGDGKLSYSEYSFLMLFLIRSTKEIKLAYHIFNKDEASGITVEEFKSMMQSLRVDPHVELTFEGGIMKKFFGQSKNLRVTEKQLLEFSNSLKSEVLRAEFRQFDLNGSNKISPRDFCTLITNSVVGSHLPFYLVSNLRKLPSDVTDISFDLWKELSSVMEVCDDLSVALQLYSECFNNTSKYDFHRALRAVSPDLSVSPRTVELIFSLFDKNGDGNLEYDEFLSVIRTKSRFNHASSEYSTWDFTKNLRKCFEKCVYERLFPV